MRIPIPTSIIPTSISLQKSASIQPRTGHPKFGGDSIHLFIRLLRPGHFGPDQYSNLGNPLAHYKTTGPEIWHQTSGKITHFVASLGTCGTISGAGKYLREQNSKVNILPIWVVEYFRRNQNDECFSGQDYERLMMN